MEGECHYLFSILKESNVIIFSEQRILAILIKPKGCAYVKIWNSNRYKCEQKTNVHKWDYNDKDTYKTEQ